MDQASVVNSWDLEKPKQFLILRKGMNPQHVDLMETEYRRYMICVASASKSLPISNAVDELWHAHLLFSQDYTKDTEICFGQYLHHMPTLSEEERAALEPFYFQDTLGTYRRLFGEPDEVFWPRESASICWSCSSPYPDPPKTIRIL